MSIQRKWSESRESRWSCFALSLLLLSGCDSQSWTGAGDSSLSIGKGRYGAPVALGDSCVSSDGNKMCLAMHFVSYEDSEGQAVASPKQAVNVLSTLNRLWSVCNIGFQIEKYETADPSRFGLSYGEESQDEVYRIRRTFAAPSDQLLAVTTGPWGTAVNAWTAMPGEGPYGAIMEASIVNYGDGIIYAHEMGHYLGLDHVSNASDLMNAVIYRDSETLTQRQCEIARETVSEYWSSMLRL